MSPCPLKDFWDARTFASEAERDMGALAAGRTASSPEMRCTSTEVISCRQAYGLSLSRPIYASVEEQKGPHIMLSCD